MHGNLKLRMATAEKRLKQIEAELARLGVTGTVAVPTPAPATVPANFGVPKQVVGFISP